MARVKIQRQDNLIAVDPPMDDMLGPELQYTRRLQTGGSKKKATFEHVPLWSVDNGRLTTSAGFTYRVSMLLEKAGHEVEFEDLRKKRLPDPVFNTLDQLREGQMEMIVAVAAHDRGVIEAPTGSGKSFIIKQICKMWPTAKIIIASPFTDIIRQILSDLREDFPPGEITMVGGGRSKRSTARITCAVDRSLGYCDLDHCDIFIYDEVHRAAAPETGRMITHIPSARMYGFSASPTGRSDGADLETEALFGPIICSKSYQEVQSTGAIVPVVVMKLSAADLTPFPDHPNTSVVERHGIWRHSGRNQMIADVVGHLRDMLKDPQILITVSTVEHAVFIGQLLPDFPLCYGSMPVKKREKYEKWGMIRKGDHPLTSRAREQMRRSFRDGELRQAIATAVWSTGVDFPHLNVLIRADGQSGPISNTQIPGRVTRSDGTKDCGIVVDFDDTHNRLLGERFKRRARQYRKKGWSITEATV